jgi:hypothetical protein
MIPDPKSLFLTLVGFVSLTVAQENFYHLLPVVPGVGSIGQSFFLLDPEKSTGN